MADLNQMELQHLRHLIGAHETAYQKLNTYSSQAVDPQIKQLFTKSAQDALNTKQKLMSFFFFFEVVMNEKIMVNDILSGVKSNLTTYQNAISETENMELRQTLQQIRNNDESFQYELFKVAQAKGYYKPAAKASVTEIDEVKSNLQ